MCMCTYTLWYVHACLTHSTEVSLVCSLGAIHCLSDWVPASLGITKQARPTQLANEPQGLSACTLPVLVLQELSTIISFFHCFQSLDSCSCLHGNHFTEGVVFQSYIPLFKSTNFSCIISHDFLKPFMIAINITVTIAQLSG